MELTVKQAAARIHVSPHTIKNLIKNGILTDLKPRKEGATKHFSIVDHKQLDEVAREHGLRGAKRVRISGASVTPVNGGGGQRAVTAPPQPAATSPTVPTSPAGVLTRIDERLSRIEEAVLRLLTMWS